MSINDLGDLANKQIEINSREINIPVSSVETPERNQPSDNYNKRRFGMGTLLTGIKGFMKLGNKSPNTSQISQNNNDNNDNNDLNEVQISSSIQQSEQQSVQNLPQTKLDQCKEKAAQMIINTIEVKKNYTVFFSLLGLGSFLLCMSVFMLPFILTSPSKFSMCFAFGSILVLISFLFFHGTKAYVEKLFQKNRFWISLLFISSILLGIIFSIAGKYFFSLLCSLFQLFSLVMFILTFVPGGRKGIESIKKKLSSPFVRVFMGMAANEINQQ